MGNATVGQLRGNLSGFKKAVRRRDIELERLRAALKEIARHDGIYLDDSVAYRFVKIAKDALEQ